MDATGLTGSSASPITRGRLIILGLRVSQCQSVRSWRYGLCELLSGSRPRVPSKAADGTEQGLVFVGWPNRVPDGRLAGTWISVLITLEITLNFVLRSARELVVHGPHAPRNPVEIRD